MLLSFVQLNHFKLSLSAFLILSVFGQAGKVLLVAFVLSSERQVVLLHEGFNLMEAYPAKPTNGQHVLNAVEFRYQVAYGLNAAEGQTIRYSDAESTIWYFLVEQGRRRKELPFKFYARYVFDKFLENEYIMAKSLVLLQ